MSEINPNIEISQLSPEKRAELLAQLTAEAAEKKPELKAKPAAEVSKENNQPLKPEQTVAASTNIASDISMEKRVEGVDPKVAQMRLEHLLEALNNGKDIDPQALNSETYGV